MEDAKNIVFRTAVRGYNKSDVNSYLVKFSADAAEREEAAKAEAKDAVSRAERAEERTRELEDKLKELEKSSHEWEDKLLALEAEKEALAQQLASEQEEIIRLEDELTALAESREAAPAAVRDDRELDELRQKAQLYEKNSSNIGETLISAQRLAQDIVDAANEEARVRDEKSRAETEARKRALEETARAASDSVFANLRILSEEGKNEVEAVREYALSVTEKALDDILGRVRQGEARLESMEDTMLGKIRGDVSRIDNTPRRRSADRRPSDIIKNGKSIKR